MDAQSVVMVIIGLSLEITILGRAARRRALNQYPLFYSYVAYVLSGTVVCTLVLWLQPDRYATVYWFYYLVMMLVEFAVLIELSDRIFQPHYAIRQMARYLTLGICVTFALFYVLPSLLVQRPADLKLLDLGKESALTKAVIISGLLAGARFYRAPLGRYVSGIILGFAIYFSVSIANFAAAGEFGRTLYTQLLTWLNSVSYAVCLLVWTISLWPDQPATVPGSRLKGGPVVPSASLGEEIRKMNTSLSRLLRK
jgi:hypothetical protein